MSGYPNLVSALAGADLADVAERSGVSVAGIEALLSGTHSAPTETRQRLADALGWRTAPSVGQRDPHDLFWRGEHIEKALADAPVYDADHPMPDHLRRVLEELDFPAVVYPIRETDVK